jgi:enoyl-CoA hydratase
MLKIEQRNAALIIMIDRPEAGNSINTATAAALERAVADASEDPALRTVIITGSGEIFFCTGGDIKEYRAVTERAQLDEVMGCSRRALRGLEALEIPVIIAINGYCLGGGFEMMLAGDIRIASADAMFALPQARLGIIPGWHGIERLVGLVGRGRAVALAAGGERIDAAMAKKFGLIDEVVAARPVLDRALEIANTFEKAAPLALKAVKKVAFAAACGGSAMTEYSEDVFAGLWFSADHREAEAAFAEKREPVFEGR